MYIQLHAYLLAVGVNFIDASTTSAAFHLANSMKALQKLLQSRHLFYRTSLTSRPQALLSSQLSRLSPQLLICSGWSSQLPLSPPWLHHRHECIHTLPKIRAQPIPELGWLGAVDPSCILAGGAKLNR